MNCSFDIFLSHPPRSLVPGIHAAGEKQQLCAVHHGHWHAGLSASDPLSLITDEHSIQRAQKSSMISGVTYITVLLLPTAATRGPPLAVER